MEALLVPESLFINSHKGQYQAHFKNDLLRSIQPLLACQRKLTWWRLQLLVILDLFHTFTYCRRLVKNVALLRCARWWLRRITWNAAAAWCSRPPGLAKTYTQWAHSVASTPAAPYASQSTYYLVAGSQKKTGAAR